MWSKAPILLLRVRAGKGGRGFGLLLFLAGYALTGFLMGLRPALELIPGQTGRRLRSVQEAALLVLWALFDEPQELVRVDTAQDDSSVYVELRTLGLPQGEGPGKDGGEGDGL